MIHGGEIYDKDIDYDFSVNLNPFPCPEAVKTALFGAVSFADKYPDIYARRFREKVALSENRLSSCSLTYENIIGGNGASELIQAAIGLISPKKVLIPVPSFSGYRHGLLQLRDVEVTEHLLAESEDFELTESFAEKIDETTDLVILANPNNPTGRAIDDSVLEGIIKKCRQTGTWIIADECFLHLSDNAGSLSGYIPEMPRLFVISAYTKLFSIPGVRTGFCLASKENIIRMADFLPEWNLSVFAQHAGIACAEQLLSSSYEKESKELVRDLRNKLTVLLRDKGLKVYPSDSCFLLVKSDINLYDKLLEKRILIRDCSNFAGLEGGFYRISVSGLRVLQDAEIWDFL